MHVLCFEMGCYVLLLATNIATNQRALSWSQWMHKIEKNLCSILIIISTWTLCVNCQILAIKNRNSNRCCRNKLSVCYYCMTIKWSSILPECLALSRIRRNSLLFFNPKFCYIHKSLPKVSIIFVCRMTRKLIFCMTYISWLFHFGTFLRILEDHSYYSLAT